MHKQKLEFSITVNEFWIILFVKQKNETVKSKNNMFPPGFEPGTFRMWGERDNHYTTETEIQQPPDARVTTRKGVYLR